jgi:hypothetical protein
MIQGLEAFQKAMNVTSSTKTNIIAAAFSTNAEENRIAGTQGSTFKTFAAWRKIMKQCSYLIQELVLFITNLT